MHGVTINALSGDNGILKRVAEAKDKTEKQQIIEMIRQNILLIQAENDGKINYANYIDILNNYGEVLDNEKLIIKEKNMEIFLKDIYDLSNVSGCSIEECVADKMLEKVNNTIAYDKYGNKIVIPAGFKILVSESNDTNIDYTATSYTVNNIDVTKGVVIIDSLGNQFVWIPTGKIYTNKEKTLYKTIKLSRYTFLEDGTPNDQGNQLIDGFRLEMADSSYGNMTAYNLIDFINSTNRNSGYYIGRYESRKSLSDNVTLKKSDKVYNIISQTSAAILSRNMYCTNNFKSDLVNSYAWDTAIVFSQIFDDRKNNINIPYSLLNGLTLADKSYDYGNDLDKICNIMDMAGNLVEWSTETSSYQGNPYTLRGGFYNDYRSTASRSFLDMNSRYIGFRLIIYLQ